MVVAGGELIMARLDLVYDDINKFYEAPSHLKANGGMFLLDDFGRQQVRPRDLLNRWMATFGAAGGLSDPAHGQEDRGAL